jgi:hypothetical protein
VQTEYPIIVVPPDAVESLETMGTKQKFWFHHSDLGLCLYKAARLNHGEDWAEKIAAELAGLLGLPVARYELGTWRDSHGVVSPTLVDGDERLVPGNELLIGIEPAYADDRNETRFRSPQHTIDLVWRAIEESGAQLPPSWSAPPEISSARGLFAGYLMLDAWIGNTDRHDENWAVVDRAAGRYPGAPPLRYLAPTHDHGSSLGRNEPDASRARRLRTTDLGDSVEAYASRARSALYRARGDRHPLNTEDAFLEYAVREPDSARYWIRRLKGVSPDVVNEVISRIPAARMTDLARQFCSRMLVCNAARIIHRSTAP